jgi:superfamily II DNA helicase RecQ
VTLTIVPLLSLGADQTAKLQSLSDSNQLPVQVYHLDEYRARDANRSLCRLINELTDATVTIFLFASPQKLLSREWSDYIGSLIKRQSVPFSLCVDECHLYAQFGAEFGAEFYGMKAPLFVPICKYRPMMPIMFLTATASTTVLDDLEDLTGLSFD